MILTNIATHRGVVAALFATAKEAGTALKGCHTTHIYRLDDPDNTDDIAMTDWYLNDEFGNHVVATGATREEVFDLVESGKWRVESKHYHTIPKRRNTGKGV